MLRVDIRQFSIVRQIVNEDICAVALMLRADILSTTLTAIKNSLFITSSTRANAQTREQI